jgi:hypothetical protein
MSSSNESPFVGRPGGTNISAMTYSSQDTEGGKSSECALDVDKPFCSDMATVKEVAKSMQYGRMCLESCGKGTT